MNQTPNHSSRAHALLSASSSARWLACPPSAVAAAAYPNQDTAFTREGTLAHEVAEFMLNFDDTSTCRRDDLLADFQNWMGSQDVTAEMIHCAEAYRDFIQELVKDESAIAMSERRVDFSPWVPGGFGTADCIIIQGHRMDVIDYKYGQGVSVSAVENSQMMLYGLGALNDYGFIYDVQTVGLHIFQPRMNNVSDWELPAAYLLDWGRAVEYTAALAAKGEGDMAAGEHCRFCPHAGRCPELARSCALIVETSDGPVEIPSLAPWQVADILAAEGKVTAWLKAVKDRALSDMLSGGEVPGYKVVAGRSSRSWADDLEVESILNLAGYTPDDYTKTELLSPYNMEKALGKKKVSELLSGQILSVPGAPTIAPASDKRQPYDRAAEIKKDFEQGG